MRTRGLPGLLQLIGPGFATVLTLILVSGSGFVDGVALPLPLPHKGVDVGVKRPLVSVSASSSSSWEAWPCESAVDVNVLELETQGQQSILAPLRDIPVPASVPAQGQGQGQGWLVRWLSMGGEGSVIVHVGSTNLTLPHRPAAFPAHLSLPLPLSGQLKPFSSFPSLPSPNSRHTELACLAPLSPIGRPTAPPPQPPYTVALIERGGCDFATKVQAAQDRGAGAVIVGDSVARSGESEEEGRSRESLITMFSPEDTTAIFIPSVFVSRASYLLLRDFLANHTASEGKEGLWIELTEAADESGTLTSLLSFALLLPSLFLLATIAIHRIRVARQREADRAPPMVVLSLPERIWTPDIVWEKDDSSSDRSPSRPRSPSLSGAAHGQVKDDGTSIGIATEALPHAEGSVPHIPPPPLITPSEILTPPAPLHPDAEVADPLASLAPSATGTGNSADVDHDRAHTAGAGPSNATVKPKERERERTRARRYFSKDECAICMDSFEKGDVVRILPCGHVFHKDECDEWLLKWRKLCPTCRADVTLPAGNIKGSTITPVTAPPLASLEGEGEEIDDPASTTGGIAALWRNVRTRLFGFGFGDGEAQGQGRVRLPLDDDPVQVALAPGQAHGQGQSEGEGASRQSPLSSPTRSARSQVSTGR